MHFIVFPVVKNSDKMLGLAVTFNDSKIVYECVDSTSISGIYKCVWRYLFFVLT